VLGLNPGFRDEPSPDAPYDVWHPLYRIVRAFAAGMILSLTGFVLLGAGVLSKAIAAFLMIAGVGLFL